ncbi:MAG: ABC transporter ATP-binding protein, partial [Candidatus Methylomirabilales bacterium]
ARSLRVQGMLETVELTALAHRYPHELSGGQNQRVALARALAPRPTVILLDEPFSNLDTNLRFQMAQELYRILRELGTTAIFVTHDHEEAFMIADRVGVLNQGRLEQIDHPEVIYHAPTTRFVARFVGKADFLPGIVTTRGIQTEVGIFQNPNALPVKNQVEIMVRPDDVTVTPDPDGNAVVVARQFRGADNLITIQLKSGTILHSHHESSLLLQPRERIQAQVHPSPVVVFQALHPWL